MKFKNIGTFLFGFAVGFVLGAYGYKCYLDHKDDVEYDIGPKIIPNPNKALEPMSTTQPEVVVQNEEPHPQDSDEDEESEYIDEEMQKSFEEGRRMTNNYYQNRDKPPEIMTLDMAADLDASVDEQVVYYYVNSTLLAFEENNEVIEDEPYYFGNCLKEFCENEVQIIFVFNYKLNTLYEVKKVYEEWTP